MKKVLVLVLSVVLVLSFGVFALAAENSNELRVYGDVMPMGTYSLGVSLSAPGYIPASTNFNASCFLASGGVEYLSDSFKLGGEVGVGSSAQTSTLTSTNLNYFVVKGGYQVLNGQFKVDANASYLIGNYNAPTVETSFNGMMLGADATFNLSREIVFDGFFDFSVAASAKTNGNTFSGNVNLSRFGMNLNYLLNETVALTGGYYLNSFSESIGVTATDNYGNPVPGATLKSTVTYGGIILGVKAKI